MTARSPDEQAGSMFRRIDTLIWLGVSALMIFAASTLWELKIESVRQSTRLASIETSLVRLTASVPDMRAMDARMRQMETNFLTLWPWRRAAQADIARLWDQAGMAASPKSSEIAQ